MQIIHFIQAHWQALLLIMVIVGLAVWAYLDWQFSNLELHGPRDTVGNGITVGRAKAFDNRSLALRIERLSNSLAQMKIVDQKITDNLGKVQGQRASSQTLALEVKTEVTPTAAPNPADEKSKKASGDSDNKKDTATEASKSESKPEVTLAAGDVLNEQVNLASQILNLQTLYERSLTDRLIGGHARLQTVLGFQVSVTTPTGFENCVAVMEVAVRMRSTLGTAATAKPVSLVAMIPQEKTYNAQSISTNAQSIAGSAVASVVTVGLTGKGESRQLFIHRDSDTVAFERDPRNAPALFPEGNAAVFGWEFRPVLGRKTVSPGMRQMLAVVALPLADKREDDTESVLEIKTRSYWRRYNGQCQTSAPKWHWWPKQINGSNTFDSEIQELTIPTTYKIQQALAPKVSNITWCNLGSNRATVIVKGENFFPGTRIVTGGAVHREEDATLTLKSDQTLEYETTLEAIVSGESVLSGRFGPSQLLNLPRGLLPVRGIYITRAAIKQSRRGKDLRISIDVKGLDDNGNDAPLDAYDLASLPEPILFLGNEPIPLPYDYTRLEPEATPAVGVGTGTGTGTERTGTGKGTGEPFSFAKTSTQRFFRVEASIPSRIQVTRNAYVMFRVPFCGLDYQASQPLRFFEPTVTRMGSDDINSVFRISHALGSGKSISVEVDKPYYGPPHITQMPSENAARFSVPNKLISQYEHMVVRIEGAEPYLVPVPSEEKPRPALDLDARPPQLEKGSIGPAEWSGKNLDMITAAVLITPPASNAANPFPTRTAVSYTVYDSGKKIAVYFTDSATNVTGKAEVEFRIGQSATDSIRAPIFILPIQV